MSERIQLGKIAHVRVGMGGYQEAMLGIWFTFEGKSWGCSTGEGTWAHKPDAHTKWTEAEQDAIFAKTFRYIGELLKAAKVDDVAKLRGVPVEVTFEGNLLRSWRVLTEVL